MPFLVVRIAGFDSPPNFHLQYKKFLFSVASPGILVVKFVALEYFIGKSKLNTEVLMNKSILSYAVTIVSLLTTCAFPMAADITNIQGGIGYRHDSYFLNVKERSSINPRAQSKRHYKDIEILLLGAKFKQTLGSCDAYVRASFDYGFVLDGKVRDRLEIEDRTEIFETHHGYTCEGEFFNSRIHNNIKNNSFVWDIDAAFAYPFFNLCDGLEIAPAIGFAVNRQQFHVKGIKCDEDISEDSGLDLYGLANTHGQHSSLRGSWWGPWLGFDFAYHACETWNIYGAFEFHVGRARRQVNAHTERVSIDHYKRTKTFFGPLLKLGTIYLFCDNWYVDANITYWKYFSDTNRDDFSWASGSARLDIGYVF